MTGPLERTNDAYALAKISGLKLCEAIKNQFKKQFISLMPTNLYGPNDNYDLNSSHVIPALIKKFHSATVEKNDEVILWGDGSPLREFLHVDDLADSIFFALNNELAESFYNVGYGKEISINDLALLVGRLLILLVK